MPELGAPVRITWDLSPDPGAARLLWDRLTQARVLFVELFVDEASLDALAALAPEFGRGGPRVSLLTSLPLLPGVAAAVGEERLRGLEVGLLPPLGQADAAEVPSNAHAAVWSTPEGLALLPEALALATLSGLRTTALLNPPAPARCLSAEDRSRAAEVWSASGLAGRVALRCHDLFLAEALGLEPFEGYSGCQAAAFLAHVDRRGRLLACRTLPWELGDLNAAALADLWATPTRRDLRARLEAAPEPCEGCALESSCRGGCRGLGAALGRDPSCPGARLGR